MALSDSLDRDDRSIIGGATGLDEDPSAPPAFNFNSIAYHTGAQLPFVFESPHGNTNWRFNGNYKDLLQLHHLSFEVVVQTLLPHDSSAEVREGFQWSDGTTMPIAAWDALSPEVELMQGKWTLGVSSDKATRTVVYLHVMRVQKADAPLPAFSADLMKTATTSGVTLKVEDRTYEILFNRIREIGGPEGKEIRSDTLATSIEAQSMLVPESLRDE